jgi:hypothetical protein
LIHENVWPLVHGVDGAGNDTGGVTWQVGHQALVRVGSRRGELDAEEAVWLVACEALGADRELGYGSFPEYVSAAVGWDVHTAMERLRVARTLVRLPGMFAKLRGGELSWSAVRELTRVVLPETEEQWLDASRGLRVADVARLVSGRRPGDLPSTPLDEGARRHVVRFEVQASTLALVRQAQDEYRRRTGASVDDDALVAALAKAYLSMDAGESCGAAAHVMVTLCRSCRRGTADAGGEALPLRPAELERLCCDARVLPDAQTTLVIAPGERMRADGPGPASPVGPDRGSVPAPELIREIERRAGLKVATEMPRTLRQAVVRRHNGRCGVTGCSNGAYLHVHHCDLRSEGGGHDPDRLIPLCDVHHGHVHEGRLLIDGSWSAGFRFRHADGTTYGTRRLPAAPQSEAARIAFSALVKNGYKQGEARQAVDAIRDQLEPGMPVEQVVRMAFVAMASLPSQQHRFGARESLEEYRPLRAA